MRFFVINLLQGLYRAVWLAAIPVMRRKPRMAIGWEQRTLVEPVAGPFDFWIQASSGGESMLTNMVLSRLQEIGKKEAPLRVLVTAGTEEGFNSLQKGAAELKNQAPGRLDITVSYFPLDAPAIMAKAFRLIKPRVAVVVETELWPGYLIAARKNSVPVLVINGRMSERSFGAYKYFHWFFSTFGPGRVLAISEIDANRFGQVVGPEKVGLMNNLKFDRITPRTSPMAANPITSVLPADVPFILLGSIRREEEEKILTTIQNLLAARRDVVIGLFPKHIERADFWLEELHKKSINTERRSHTSTAAREGSVIVWDVFGELAGAYALATAAFVGGSLLNLGGQNFLEPLVFGLRPVIGPYWKNFAWVGREIVDVGLVREVQDEEQLTRVLLADLDENSSREEIIKQVEAFFRPRQGGTDTACEEILSMLKASKTTVTP